MAQVSRTGLNFTPAVGPAANVAARFIMGATPIAFGTSGRGYPCAATYITTDGIVRVTIAVADATYSEDPIWPGQDTASHDGSRNDDGLIPYDDAATTLDLIAADHWTFISQLTS